MVSPDVADRQLLILRIDAAQLPIAESLLTLAGSEAICIAGDGDEELLEPAPRTTPLWRRVTVRALFPNASDLNPLLGLLTQKLRLEHAAAIERLSEKQWLARSGGATFARNIGRRIHVTGPNGAVPEGRSVVRLHFGLAFGTGEHPTTRLCLEWLDAHLQTGSKVLDYGCGSAILAVAALALGASRAWAVDIDPQALAAARANADLNAVGDVLWIGPPEDLPQLQVDVIVANILARPLIELAPLFARTLRPGGHLVMSGLLDEQCEAVRRVLTSDFSGFDLLVRDGWARLACIRAVSD